MQIKLQTDGQANKNTYREKTDEPTGQQTIIFTLLTINNNKNK